MWTLIVYKIFSAATGMSIDSIFDTEADCQKRIEFLRKEEFRSLGHTDPKTQYECVNVKHGSLTEQPNANRIQDTRRYPSRK